MDVTRRISTRQTAYREYLETPKWRNRRDAKLRSVGYHCERCDSRRELQVHHRTYERLGEELDSDLEVVCVKCHEREHAAKESPTEFVRLYVAVAKPLLNQTWSSGSDFMEALKCACAAAHIPYDTEKLTRAMSWILRQRPRLIQPDPAVHVYQAAFSGTRPPSAFESRRILEQYGLIPDLVLPDMPKAKLLRPSQVAILKAKMMIAGEILASVERCEALEAAVKESECDPEGSKTALAPPGRKFSRDSEEIWPRRFLNALGTPPLPRNMTTRHLRPSG